jgi:transcriptional regulator with XRE-family HTH domain
MRKVVEYLRKKNNLTIEDLVVEICSSTMYYKYLSGEKNMSEKNLTLIKERLGADIITKEEIEEFKIELNKIIYKLIRYYNSRKEFEEDFSSLLEIEPQLLLNEELIISYGIIKLNYYLVNSCINEGIIFSEILEDYYDKM